MTRPLKAGALALAILGLLVVVAMAARGGHPGTSGHVSTRPVPDTLQDSFVTLLAIAYIVVVVAIVVGVVRYRGRWRDPGSHWLGNFVLVTLLMLLATAIGYYGMTHSDLRKKAEQAVRAQAQAGKKPGGRRGARPVPARQAHFQWPLAAGIGGLVLLGGVWIYLRNRRAISPVTEEDSLEAELVSTIDTTIEDLRRERDPRRAVIAAYAAMERTLAAHGLARPRADAPLEYLARILRSLNVRDSAVRTLTDLFEYAKFSRHEIDATMKEEAIDALLAIRADLQQEEELAA